jgi:hypothetical protein
MKLISHRGNINGREPKSENSPDYITSAIKKGFDVEIDVWSFDGIYLGHDKPQYEIDLDFLFEHQNNLWIHCKNIASLAFLTDFGELNTFWHEEDSYTLTSQGYIWTYPHKKICHKSVIVAYNARFIKYQDCFGVCADILR